MKDVMRDHLHQNHCAYQNVCHIKKHKDYVNIGRRHHGNFIKAYVKQKQKVVKAIRLSCPSTGAHALYW
jgi:hypothetical protein